MERRRGAIVLWAALVAGGCTAKPAASDAAAVEPPRTATAAEQPTPPPPIDLSSYSKTCSQDADCTLVLPQPCAECGCASTPIAASEHERFAAAMAKVKCPAGDLWPDVDCGGCMSMQPYCDAGNCAARPME